MSIVKVIAPGQITLDQMADIYSEMIDIKTASLNNLLIHVGEHPEYGNISLTQWGANNFATLQVDG